jgi:mannose-6-phosphate isomerase
MSSSLAPLRFTPLIKRIRWGGVRLGTHLSKPIGAARDAAESWEVCDHGVDQSVVAAGPFSGWTLQRLVRERNAELFGRHAPRSQFPWLMKFLDASDRLSVQVHPNDAQAREFDLRENGKTEAWIVLDARPDSPLFVGLKPGVAYADLKKSIAHGAVESCLHSFVPAVGDCIYVPAGTVHAIGEGILIAEVQQPSDLTFRLYDWGRVGADGKPRDVHVEQSLRCTDFEAGPGSPVRPVSLPSSSGTVLSEELVRCPYFVMRRHTLTGPFAFALDSQCRMVSVLDGRGELNWEGGSVSLQRGDTFVLPAAAPGTQLAPSPSATILETTLE